MKISVHLLRSPCLGGKEAYLFANPAEYVHSAFSRKKHQSISVTVDCKTNLVSSVKCQGFVFIRPAFFV